MSRTTLLKLDATIIHSVLAVIAKNWKDAATILFFYLFLYAVGKQYASAASESARFYATVLSSFLCGYGVVSFARARLERLSDASPFTDESLNRVHVKTYFGAWSVASLLFALCFAAIIYPSGMLYAVATWFGAGMLSFLISSYSRFAITFGFSSETPYSFKVGRLAGMAASAIAISAIVVKALLIVTPDFLNIVLIAAHGAAIILFSPVKADEIQFLRIVGHGFTERCLTALLPILVITGVNCALVYALLGDLPMLASVAIVSFVIATYRIVQIGLFRLMSVRAAEVALGLYMLSLLLLGITFPPLAAVFYGLVLVLVCFRAWRAAWLME